MAFPSVNSRSGTTAGGNATTLTASLPATIAKGELIYASFARDGTGAMTWGTGLCGWNILYDVNDTGTAACKAFYAYKIANGDEDGGTLSLTSPSEEWCVETGTVSGVDLNTPPEYATAGDGGTGSTNPNPPNLAPSWGAADTLWQAIYAGDGNVNSSIEPSSYSNYVSRLSGGTSTNRCSHGYADRELNASSENPGAFTRGSEDWAAITVALRPEVASPAHPTLLRQQAFYSASGTTVDVTITIDSGTNRRLCVSTMLEASGITVTAVALDPTGANISLAKFTDGSTTAEQNQGSLAWLCWWGLTDSQLPSPGSYTLRCTVSSSAELFVNAIMLQNCQQDANISDVAVGGSDGATGLTVSVTVGQEDSMVLFSAYANNTPALTGQTVAGLNAMGYGQCALPTAGAFMSVGAKGMTTQTGSQDVVTTASASVRRSCVALVFAPAVEDIEEALTGSAASISVAAGSLTASVAHTRALTGSALGVAVAAGSVAASVSQTRSLSGSAIDVAVAAGDVEQDLGFGAELEGSEASVAVEAGNLSVALDHTRQLSGSEVGVALQAGSVAASVSHTRALSGATAGVAVAAGNVTKALILNRQLSGSALGVGVAAGTLGRTFALNRTLTGEALNISVSSGSLAEHLEPLGPHGIEMGALQVSTPFEFGDVSVAVPFTFGPVRVAVPFQMGRMIRGDT